MVPVPGWKLPTFVLFSGDGSLTATVTKIERRTPQFSGGGLLVGAPQPIVPGSAVLAGDGSLAAQFSQIIPIAIAQTGQGTLSAIAYDATIGNPAWFLGEGTLSASVIGGWSQGDGLSAWWYQIYPQAVQLTGNGSLAGLLIGELQNVVAQFAGAGALSSATVIAVNRVLVAFAGSGALSSQAYQLFRALVNLNGGGALGATTVIQYLLAPQYGGGGILTPTTSQIYNASTPTFTDGIVRANSTTSPGNGWTNRNGVIGVISNALYPVPVTTWCEATAPVTMAQDDMEVSIVLGAFTGGGDYATILLGMSAAGEGIFAFFNGGSGVTIYTQSLWDTTGLASQASAAVATSNVGDQWTVRRRGNTYTVFYNGGLVLTWPDSLNIIPRDANHRQVGVAQYTDGTGYRAIESFTATSGGVSGVGASGAGGEGTMMATVFKREFRTAAPTGIGTLAATVGFAPNGPASQNFTTAGAYTYAIPWWANKIDMILLGGGGGGASGNYSSTAGNGGKAAVYTMGTLVRGVDIPWSTTQITGTVGVGGTAGSGNNVAGGAGGATTATGTGMATSSSAGAAGGSGTGSQGGQGPGNTAWGGISANGGAAGSGNGGAGGAPGAGAAGGNGSFLSSSAGGVGGRGQAWFYAYQ